VAPTTDSSVRVALTLESADLEDAVCAASAQEAGCAAIVTRNPKRFKKSDVPAMLPEAFLASQLAEAADEDAGD
jgi:hypothetical protein